MGHIVYFGVKKRYISEITTGNDTQNYAKDQRIASMSKGFGVLSFPYDKNINPNPNLEEAVFISKNIKSNITNEQRLATQLLLLTNYKGSKDQYTKSLDIDYGNMEHHSEIGKYDYRIMEYIFQPDLNKDLNVSDDDIQYGIECFHNAVLNDIFRLNRLKRELSSYEKNTNMDVKNALRELYSHIQNSNLSPKQRGEEFSEVIRVAQSYTEDPTVHGYMIGAYDRLKISNNKLFSKVNRYQDWIDHLHYIQENKLEDHVSKK